MNKKLKASPSNYSDFLKNKRLLLTIFWEIYTFLHFDKM